MSLRNGEYAVNVYSNYEPDVIIIDSILPGMDGLETARWIKEQTNSIKIVMVAQHFNDEFLLACVELNLNGYIIKNSSEQILIELN